MKRKHRDAMRAQARIQDMYIDGMSDDEQAAEMLDWHDEYAHPYKASADHHIDEQTLPF